MSKHAFDTKLDALTALRTACDPTAASEHLRRTLADRNNYLVARAAEIAAELKLAELLPDLLAAYDRLFVDPGKSDPQCLGKNAIAKALKDLGHRDAQAYLRGIVHVQFEPAWGGRADSAATLRGRCALALPDCHLDHIEVLTYLTDGLADPETLVRIDSASAIHQLGRREGALGLRLKLLAGDREPEVMGQCFAALLSLSPGSVPFISRFLESADEAVQLEAASALAQSHDAQAIAILEEFWQKPLLSLDLRRALLISLGASPLPEAAEFLLSIVENESADFAASAISALTASRFHAEMADRIAAVVKAKDSPATKSCP